MSGLVVLGCALGAGLLLGVLVARRRGPGEGLNVVGFVHVNINCSDFARSRRFYERLGFRVMMEVAPDGEGAVAAAVGLPAYRVRGALLAHRDGSMIDLLQWEHPADPAPPYEALNHLGLARVALQTTDLDGDVAKLRAEGVEFLSDEPGAVPDSVGGTTRFICFRDPDGTVLELIEMGAVMGALSRASKAATRGRRRGRLPASPGVGRPPSG